FAAACSGSDLEHGKPAPDIFLKAAAMLDAPPGECFVFEDSFNGIRAAHAGGMHPMMVVDLLEPDDEMRKISDGIFYSMNEVRKCLLQ
ncbi:MAG: HAD family hydrolase, partial [Lachnospiraceae bacterium]|nr:HAD family hydrolase [Lachnospiraceae bacterium]